MLEEGVDGRSLMHLKGQKKVTPVNCASFHGVPTKAWCKKLAGQRQEGPECDTKCVDSGTGLNPHTATYLLHEPEQLTSSHKDSVSPSVRPG